MFGHQDDKKDDHKDDEQKADAATTTEVKPDQPVDGTQDDDQSDQAAPDDGNDSPPDTSSGDDDAWQHPGEPIDEDESPGQISDIITPGGANPDPVPPMPVPPRNNSDDDSDEANVPHELIDIKQKALGKLTPLIDKLDQTPEDRFRTTMMMIQASDDQALVKAAYEAADAIEDEKVRAQALLDVVNEINYFTQHPKSES